MNAAYFKSQLQRHDMSQRALAKAIGRSPMDVTLMFKGTRKIRLEDATEMARIFSVPLDEILEASGVPVQGVKRKDSVPVVGWIDGESVVHVGAPKGDKRAPAPAWGVSPRLRAVRYQTNGTKLEGMNSALLYFNEGTAGEISIDDLGRLAVIELSGQGTAGAVVGVLKRAGSGSFRRFDVFSAAGVLLREEVGVERVSPVVWIKM